MYELILVYSYLAIGIYCICNNYNIDQNYILLLLFFLLKSLFDYRKCTVSYLETKLRAVKKKDGYLFTLMDDILNIRNTEHIGLIYIVCSVILYYYFGIKEDIIYYNLFAFFENRNDEMSELSDINLSEIDQENKDDTIDFLNLHGSIGENINELTN